MEPKTPVRFSFKQTAAQQPERQRFSFAAAPKTKEPTISEALNKQFPYREMIQAAPAIPPKPTLPEIAREFVLPKRGFTDEAVRDADPTLKEIGTGTIKAVGEVGVGLAGLSRLGLEKIPGYKKLFPTNEEFLSKVEEAIKPKTAGEAKVMRTADIAGFVPLTAGRLSKLSKIDDILKAGAAAQNPEAARLVLKQAGASDDFIDSLKLDQKVAEAPTSEAVKRVFEETLSAAPKDPKRFSFNNTTPSPDELTQTIPAEKTPTTRERGFVTSVKEKVPEASKVAGQYIVRDTDELAIKARNEVESNPVKAEDYIRNNTDERSVAMAAEYIKKLSDDAAKATDEASKMAFYDKAADIANDLAPRLTEAGRTIQAASILGRMTPAGQIRFAAKEIQRFNRANPSKRIPELTGEQAKFIGDEMEEIAKMPDGIERAMRFKKVQDYVQDLVPTPLWKKVSTVWKAGLLTGLKTSGLNILSNLSHFTSEIVKDAPAAVVDRAASLFTGERTKVFTMRGAFDGIKEGGIKGKRYFFTGFDERNLGEKLDYTRVNFGKGPVAKAFKAYTETVFRVIGAQDQPFYYASLSRSLMDQALAKGMNQGLKGKELVEYAYKIVENPTEEMVRYATADASTAVFMNRTKLGEAASTVQKIPYVGEFFIPFARTPSSVAMQIISYSPVGFVKAAVDSVASGKFDQRVFSHGTGRAIIGTAVMAIGAKLAEEGLVSESFPIGDEREQELQRAEGTKSNAIKVGDTWRSPLVLGPLGNLLLVGAEFQRALEENGSPTEAISKATLGSVKAFTEQTFLTGLSDAVNAITDPERYASQYLPNLVASFVPTLVSDIARATDDVERRPDTTIDRIAARIPGARQTVEPQVDILGRQQERVGNPLQVLIDPTRPSPEVGTVVTEELRRLTASGFPVSPTKLGDRQGYESLSPENNTRLWEVTGQIINQKLSALFSNEQYLKASDDQKAKAVEGIVDKAKDYSRAALVVSLTQDLEGAELAAKLKELKESGVLTRDVYRMYGDIR